MGFLDESGSMEFSIPKDLEAQLPKMKDLKPGDKSSVKAPCGKWKLTNMRAGWNKDNTQLCVNIVAAGLEEKYHESGETENWLRTEYVSEKGHVQRDIANSYANLLVDIGLSNAKDWGSENMTGQEILNTISNVVNAGEVVGFFDAGLVWTRRAYKNRDGQTVPVNEAQFQYIQNGRKTK